MNPWIPAAIAAGSVFWPSKKGLRAVGGIDTAFNGYTTSFQSYGTKLTWDVYKDGKKVGKIVRTLHPRRPRLDPSAQYAAFRGARRLGRERGLYRALKLFS